ncbi:MAG: alpha/beta hydrolase [Alphaproteobacteria bacterium]|nr:alpha/beta hydrolase [Alphaproteobacteria bacterium]
MPEIVFNGPEGRLEGRYRHGRARNAPIALILHPHPRHGGTMNNKVVYSLFQSFHRAGFSVLRFNFRGVGRSQGVYDNGVGEISDATSAFDWMQAYNPHAAGCWIGGFSFGAWIAMQVLMRRPEIDSFVCVAPPVGLYNFGFLEPCPSSGLLIHGSEDQLVPAPDVLRLRDRLCRQKAITVDYTVIDGANHFFDAHAGDFQAAVDSYLARRTKDYVLREGDEDEAR